MECTWNNYFSDRGLSPDIIKQYVAYANNLERGNLPVVFEIEHLANLIGIKYPEINNIIFGAKSFYRTFKIPKRRGGCRVIQSPYPSLLSCQKWIYNNILKKVQTHPCAYAYKENISIIHNASIHLNADFVLKLDLSDFFHSIPKSWVVNFFSELGYANNVSVALASLCCVNDSLPQGGVTSPALSNILVSSLDERLNRLAHTFDLSYSRYADDMVFSGKRIPATIIKYVTGIIESFGFAINDEKTKLLIKERQKIITGIDTTGPKLTLPRNRRREIKKAMFFINKHGLVAHMNNEKIRNPNYLLSLEGKIRFWLQIDPENNEAKKFLGDIIRIKLN
ncbi:RNA-directed DNA polymerase [Serratia sp. S1B]|nr:RNA-directed DNA polymerase [Serratia sp. S1B]